MQKESEALYMQRIKMPSRKRRRDDSCTFSQSVAAYPREDGCFVSMRVAAQVEKFWTDASREAQGKDRC